MAVFAKTENALPCSRLALTAHDFSDLVSGRGSIASFLCANLRPTAAIESRCGGGGGGEEGGSASSPASSPAGGVVSGVGDEKGVFSRGRTETTTEPRDAREPRSNTSSGGSSSLKGGKNHSPSAENETRSPRKAGEVCPKCGETLAGEEDLREHLDFHYAEGLQERYSREGDVARDMAARMSDPGGLSKRRREGNKGKGGKRGKGGREGPRIDSFFKPA